MLKRLSLTTKLRSFGTSMILIPLFLASDPSFAVTEFLPLLEGDLISDPRNATCSTVTSPLRPHAPSKLDIAYCESAEAKRLLAEVFPPEALNQALEDIYPPGHAKAGTVLCRYCSPKDPSGLSPEQLAKRKDPQGYYRLDHASVLKACNSVLVGSLLKKIYEPLIGMIGLPTDLILTLAKGSMIRDIDDAVKSRLREQVLKNKSGMVQALVRSCKRMHGEESDECYSYKMNRVLLDYLETLNHSKGPDVDSRYTTTIHSEILVLGITGIVTDVSNHGKSLNCLPLEQRTLIACDFSGELLLTAFSASLSGSQLARWAKFQGRLGRQIGNAATETLAAEAAITRAAGASGKAKTLLTLQKKVSPERYAQLYEKALLEAKDSAEFTQLFSNRALHAQSMEVEVLVNNKLQRHVKTFFARKPSQEEITQFLEALPDAKTLDPRSLITVSRQNVTQDLLSYSSTPAEYLKWARTYKGTPSLQRMIYTSKPHFEEMIKKISDPKKILEHRRNFLKLLESATQ